MKLLSKILTLSAVMVILAVASAILFKNHPEVQLAFFLPGIFILVYSIARDQVYVTQVARLRMARGR